MERRRHLEAQARQLKREIGRHPWLFARLGDLLISMGRTAEAQTLLARGTRNHENYPSGWHVLSETLLSMGENREAAAARERVMRLVPGIHAAWIQAVEEARREPERHLALLQQVWELDQFSSQRNLELEQAGLRKPAEYEQTLRPTAVEAARREEQFRRLLDRHADGSEPVRDSAESSAAEPQKDQTAEESDPAEVEPASGTEPLGNTPEARASVATDLEVEDDSEDEVEPADFPLNHGRDRTLQEQAERLESLTRPLNLPLGLPEDPSRRVASRPGDLFDPRSIHTRRLARIYLEQGYAGLAMRTIQTLREREPEARDLDGLLDQARELEHRVAEQQSQQKSRVRTRN